LRQKGVADGASTSLTSDMSGSLKGRCCDRRRIALSAMNRA